MIFAWQGHLFRKRKNFFCFASNMAAMTSHERSLLHRHAMLQSSLVGREVLRDESKNSCSWRSTILFVEEIIEWQYRNIVFACATNMNPPSIKQIEVISKGLGFQLDSEQLRVCQGKMITLAHDHRVGWNREYYSHWNIVTIVISIHISKNKEIEIEIAVKKYFITKIMGHFFWGWITG